MRKVYIGDSVYLEIDSEGLTLTTENGYPDDPRNKIVLEWAVYRNLSEYVEALMKEHERHSSGKVER
jgi:hypothetical protein